MKHVDPTIYRRIGERIKIARLQAGLTQEGIADALKITFQQVQKYEKGVNRCPINRLNEISKLTGHSMDWFMEVSPSDNLQESDLVSKMLATRAGVQLAAIFVDMPLTKQNTLLDVAKSFVKEST